MNDSNSLATLGERAYGIRLNALRMGEVQGQGYIAQALGIADVLAVAYFHAMIYRPEDPKWEGRDRFLLSNGHFAIAHYAAKLNDHHHDGPPAPLVGRRSPTAVRLRAP